MLMKALLKHRCPQILVSVNFLARAQASVEAIRQPIVMALTGTTVSYSLHDPAESDAVDDRSTASETYEMSWASTHLTPPPTMKWDKYRDPASGVCYWHKDDYSRTNWFWVTDATIWNQYVTSQGRKWWHSAADWFFENTGRQV